MRKSKATPKSGKRGIHTRATNSHKRIRGTKRSREIKDTFTVDSIDCVDISSLPLEKNVFEVVATVSDHLFLSQSANRIEYIKATDKVMRKLDPSWDSIEWPDDTNEFQLIAAMNERLLAFLKKNPSVVHVLKRQYDDSKTPIHSFYHAVSDGSIYKPSVFFLLELKKIDPLLAKIITAVIGKVALHIEMSLWQDAYATAFEYLADMEDNGELAQNFDDDDLKAVKADMDYWMTGDPMTLHREMFKLSNVKTETIKKWIRDYKWNTVWRRRVLVWLRTSEKVLKQHNTLMDYVLNDGVRDGDIIFQHQYCVFNWSDIERTHICGEFNQHMDSWLGNSEQFPMMANIDITKPVTPDKEAAMIDRWMAFSDQLFSDQFCKYHVKTKSKKLINIL